MRLFLLRSRQMRISFLWAIALAAVSASAAERTFNLGDYPLDKTPPGFRSTVAGQGRPGDWKVILDEVSPALQPLTSQAPSVSRRPVVAQLARNAMEMHFPMLIFDGEAYGDFKFTARFKIVGGALEQVAGLVFGFQSESNFYVVCASALGNSFRCFKVVNAEWKPPLGPELEVARGSWHELAVECEGTRILCSLDGTNTIKLIDAAAGRTGKIGFCTQSDSVSYFTDAKVTYAEREGLAQRLVRDAMAEYPRLLGVKIYAVTAGGKAPEVIASKDPKDVGQPGGKTEQDVISHGTPYVGKTKGSAFLAVPLRDRNGDPIAAVCVALKSFPGQTDENIAIRAQPVVQKMQARVQSLEDLLQ